MWRCGETGRRAGLKIQWAQPPCRFESDQRYQIKHPSFCLDVLSFSNLVNFIKKAYPCWIGFFVCDFSTFIKVLSRIAILKR